MSQYPLACTDLKENKYASKDECQSLCALLDKDSCTNSAYSSEGELIRVYRGLGRRWEGLASIGCDWSDLHLVLGWNCRFTVDFLRREEREPCKTQRCDSQRLAGTSAQSGLCAGLDCPSMLREIGLSREGDFACSVATEL